MSALFWCDFAASHLVRVGPYLRKIFNASVEHKSDVPSLKKKLFVSWRLIHSLFLKNFFSPAILQCRANNVLRHILYRSCAIICSVFLNIAIFRDTMSSGNIYEFASYCSENFLPNLEKSRNFH